MIKSITLLFLLFLSNFVGLYSFSQQVSEKVTIIIQPLGDIPPSYVSYVHNQASQILANIITKAPIPLPQSAYFTPRSRYRADSLIDYLDRLTPPGQVTIGLTIADISCTDPRSPDWGIFGLSYCPGKSCVASSYRLHGPTKLVQLYKVAIHELGHTQGLDHCPDTTCIMQDAKGHNTTANESGFCKICIAKLKAKGWQF